MAKVGDQQKQLICVECGNGVPELYTPNSSPGNIKLAICVCNIRPSMLFRTYYWKYEAFVSQNWPIFTSNLISIFHLRVVYKCLTSLLL